MSFIPHLKDFFIWKKWAKFLPACAVWNKFSFCENIEEQIAKMSKWGGVDNASLFMETDNL